MAQIIVDGNEDGIGKAGLRRTLIATRLAIAPEIREQWDEAIGRQVFDWCLQNPVDVLGIYWPMRGEPDLWALYERLALRGVQLALPVVVGDDLPLRFVGWRMGDALVKDRFGTMVPADLSELVVPQALLVPCVGFNSGRFRLGYGGGFYDRTLAVLQRPLAVGVAYSCLVAEFDSDLHDVAMDVIFTEAGVR